MAKQSKQKSKSDGKGAVIRTSTYTITMQCMQDGTFGLKRENKGFNPMELLGICAHTQLEIMKQISGDIKPDIIERKVYVDKK